jgi:hypothetical protein
VSYPRITRVTRQSVVWRGLARGGVEPATPFLWWTRFREVVCCWALAAEIGDDRIPKQEVVWPNPTTFSPCSTREPTQS